MLKSIRLKQSESEEYIDEKEMHIWLENVKEKTTSENKGQMYEKY